MKFNHTDVGSISCPWNSVMMPESPETSNNYTPEKSKLKHLMNPTLMTTVFSSIHYSNSVNMYHIYHTLVKPVSEDRFWKGIFFLRMAKIFTTLTIILASGNHISKLEDCIDGWPIISQVNSFSYIDSIGLPARHSTVNETDIYQGTSQRNLDLSQTSWAHFCLQLIYIFGRSKSLINIL